MALTSIARGQELYIWSSGSYATAVTSDGTSAVGGTPGLVKWTGASGIVSYGEQIGPYWVGAGWAIAEDGRTVVGSAINTQDQHRPLPQRRAMRTFGPGTARLLDPISGYLSSDAVGVTGDGRMAVGMSGDRSLEFGEACIWDENGAVSGLGHLRPQSDLVSKALAVSRDGTTVVGYSAGFDVGGAFVWTSQTRMRELEDPAHTLGGASALCVNVNGNLIGGMTGDGRACLWRDGVGEILGDLGSSITSISDDGSIVLGSRQPVGGTTAVIFLSDGPRLLIDYLIGLGIDFDPSASIQNAVVSGNGETFCGTLRDARGSIHGFVATIPAPSTQVVLLAVVLLKARPRRLV